MSSTPWGLRRVDWGLYLSLLCFFVAAFLLFAMAAGANDLPDKPQPAGHVRTANREYWSEVVAMGAAWTMDTISTQQVFNHCPGCIEAGYLFAGERSTAKSQAAWGAINVGTAVLGYEWKKHVHNKYLHPLWRGFMLSRIYAHSSAAIGNWRQL